MNPGNSESWPLGLAVAAGVCLVGWVVMRLLLAWLPRLLRHTKTQVDDLLFAAVRPHIPIWFLALGLVVGARHTPLPHSTFTWIDRTVTAAVILSVSVALASFLARGVRLRAEKGVGLLPKSTLVENAIRLGVVGLGIVVVLGQLGVAITPILTALGVGSLAVALALQPTLTNLFAGFQLTLAGLIRIGDYVELDNGQRGYVEDIGWRSTQIRELADNTIVLPNSRLAEMVVKNYSLPDEEHGASVTVTVAYGSDLERVLRVALEAARQVQLQVEGAVPDAEPGALFSAFQDSGIQLSVFARVRSVRDRGRVTHELITLLHRRFREEGIEIPLPQRVVHVHPARTGESQPDPQRTAEPAAPTPREAAP